MGSEAPDRVLLIVMSQAILQYNVSFLPLWILLISFNLVVDTLFPTLPVPKKSSSGIKRSMLENVNCRSPQYTKDGRRVHIEVVCTNEGEYGVQFLVACLGNEYCPRRLVLGLEAIVNPRNVLQYPGVFHAFYPYVTWVVGCGQRPKQWSDDTSSPRTWGLRRSCLLRPNNWILLTLDRINWTGRTISGKLVHITR